jgi:hypothetical protein
VAADSDAGAVPRSALVVDLGRRGYSVGPIDQYRTGRRICSENLWVREVTEAHSYFFHIHLQLLRMDGKPEEAACIAGLVGFRGASANYCCSRTAKIVQSATGRNGSSFKSFAFTIRILFSNNVDFVALLPSRSVYYPQ